MKAKTFYTTTGDGRGSECSGRRRKSGERAGGTASNSGFTLIELMMAMIILAVGLTAVVQMSVVTVRGHTYSREWMEAYDIAQSVLEDLKVKLRPWMNQGGCNVTSLSGLLPGGAGEVMAKITDEPSGDIPFNNLGSWPELHGRSIAGDAEFGSSFLTNMFGYTSSTASNSFQSARTIYRVHFVAHRIAPEGTDVCTAGGNANAQMVRITVFVSWKNKDHGAQEGTWLSFTDQDDFWNRHMIAVTSIEAPQFNWEM